MLKRNEPYAELGAHSVAEQEVARKKGALVRQLETLGYAVQLTER